jgi:predicted DCC family thiol-disulfide oxidoreductase YuxK
MMVCAVVFVIFTLGYRTKLFHCLAWVCLISLDSRLIPLTNGGDVVLNLLMVWGLFLPLGKRFSIDALLASMRARRESRPEALADREAMASSTEPVHRLAVLALILQFFAIYLFNVLHKTGPSWVKDGSAVHLALHQDRIVTPLGVWLRENLPVDVLVSLTFATLVIEALGAAFIITPVLVRHLRLAAFVLMPGLHFGFAACVDVGPFSYAMASFFPLMLCRNHWNWLERVLRPRRPARTMYFDADCGICFQTARILARLDPGRRLTLEPNAPERLPQGVDPALADSTILVVDARGRVHTRARAVAETCRALPFGWIPWLMLRTPGIEQLANLVYDAVSRNRRRISVAMGLAACGVPSATSSAVETADAPTSLQRLRTRVGLVLNTVLTAIVLAACFGELVNVNAAVPRWMKYRQPEPLAAIVGYGRLFQGWRMFAPHAPPEDFNIMVEARTVDGRTVDPYNEVATRNGTQPPDRIPPALMQDQFFCSYSLFFPGGGFRPYWGAFEEWVKAYHLRTGNPRDRITRFKVYKLSDTSPPLGQTEPYNFRKELLITYPHPTK